MLYQGVTVEGTKVSYAWADITPLLNCGSHLKGSAKVHVFTSELLPDIKPGQIFEFKSEMRDKTLVVHPETNKFKGMWLNQDDIAKWQAINNANQRTVEILTLRKKEGAYRWDLECLRPLKNAYRSLLPNARDVLLSQIITYVTRPPKKK